MADRARTVWKLYRAKWAYEAIEIGEVTVTTGDTVTIGGLYSTANPYNVVFWNQSTGAEIPNTHVAGTNVCTIGAGAANTLCIYMAFGRKA